MKQFGIIFLVVWVCFTYGKIRLSSFSLYSKQINAVSRTAHSISSLLELRGGANAKDKKKTTKKKSKVQRKKEEVKEAVEEVEPDENEEDGADNNEVADNHKPSFISDILSKTPPITRYYLLSSLALTVVCFVLNKNQWPEMLVFDWKGLLTLQFWRLYTGFLYFGGLDMFYPLTLQFVWQHMGQLEKMNYKHPADFVMMCLFGAVGLIVTYSFLGISMRFLGHNLATYFVYIWARMFEGMEVNFMDLFTLKAELLPWFFCAQTWLLEQEIPFADLIGILVGHIYSYLKKKDVLKAPKIVSQLMDTEYFRREYSKFRGEFE